MNINVKVKANHRFDGIKAEPDFLKVFIKALPEKGKANAYLLKYLAKVFGVANSEVQLIQGKSTNRKLVAVNLPQAEINSIIQTLKEDDTRRA